MRRITQKLKNRTALFLALFILALAACEATLPNDKLDAGSHSQQTHKAPKQTIDGTPCSIPGDAGTSTTEQCLNSYGTCAQFNCQSQYRDCLGFDYANHDYSGGACSTFLTCANPTSGTSCDQCAAPSASNSCSSCAIDATCQSCVDTEINACVLENCFVPYFVCVGLPIVRATGGCTALKNCCMSLSGSEQVTCSTAMNDVISTGDLACNSILTNFLTTGQCQ